MDAVSFDGRRDGVIRASDTSDDGCEICSSDGMHDREKTESSTLSDPRLVSTSHLEEV